MKRIALLTTGGTIAMKTGPDGLGIPALGAKDLLASVPQLASVADVSGRDIMSGRPSAGFTLDDLALFAREARAALRDADGVVITHGTDTLEDTAFALGLLLADGKPVVVTGAMRRADMPGADGPANIIAACRVAASDDARGVLVVMNDEIHAAAHVRKAHSFLPDAFASAPGPLGWVKEGHVHFALRPATPLPQLALGAARPLIPLVETGFNCEPGLFDLFADEKTWGLVIAMTGAGHIAATALDALEKLAARRPVIFASRTGAGGTLTSTYGFEGAGPSLIRRGLIPAGSLTARQARTALMLLLSDGADIAAVRDYFGRFSA